MCDEYETKRQAAYHHFVSTLIDLPFLLMGIPLLITWRAPVLIADMVQAFRLTRRGKPVHTCYCFKSRSKRPFEAWRFIAVEQFIALCLDLLCVPCILVIIYVRHLLSYLGLRNLLIAMDPNFPGPIFEMLGREASAIGSDRRMRDGSFQADAWLAGVPLLRYMRCGLAPHIWAIRQIVIVVIHLPLLVLGGFLLLTPRHASLVHGFAACEDRPALRRLVLLNAAWLGIDVLALPFVAVVLLGVWRVPTFLSLLEQRAFHREQGWRFFAAALVSLVLMLQDVLLIVIVLLILVTGVRAPHLCSAACTLASLYRQMWSEPRWQTDDGHLTQLLQLVLTEMERQRAQARARRGEPPVSERDLAEWGASGLVHFLRTDASSQTGGGLVYVARGRVRSVPRSLSLYQGLVLSEAMLAATALPQLLLLPIKALGALVAVPIVTYLRWRLRAPALDEADEQVIVQEAWSSIQRDALTAGGSRPATAQARLRPNEPPMELGVAALQLVRSEQMLRHSLTVGPLAKPLLLIAFEWTPLSLDPSILHKYVVPAGVGLMLIVINDVAALLAVPMRLACALLTFGFGCLWGREPELYFRPSRPRCYRYACTLSRMLQYISLPMLVLLQASLLVLPPLLSLPTTREWIEREHAQGVILDGDLAIHELLPVVAALPLYSLLMLALWAIEWVLSLWLLWRIGATTVLWQLPPGTHTLRDPTMPAEGFSCRRLLPGTLVYYAVTYIHLLGWATNCCYRLGGLGEVPLLAIVVVWAGWPLLPPYLGMGPGWYLLAAPAALFLLFLANGQIAGNWRDDPQVANDARTMAERLERDKEERWQAFLRLRAQKHRDELELLCARLSALPLPEQVATSPEPSRVQAIDPFMEDDGSLLQLAASGGRRASTTIDPTMGPRARVRWSREHQGVEKAGKRVESIWNAVWVPLMDDVSASLDVALAKGHVAYPLDAEHYVDLTSIWNPPQPERPSSSSDATGGDDEDGDEQDALSEDPPDEEVQMSWWLRRNPPPVAHFGLRRLDEAGTYWATARPRRFVQRSIVRGAGGAQGTEGSTSGGAHRPSARSWFGLASWGARHHDASQPRE